MKLSKLSIIGSIAIAATALVAPAQAAPAYTPNFQAWPSCSQSRTVYCVEDFKSDTDGNGTTTWRSVPSGVTVESYFFNRDGENLIPSFAFNVKNADSQELAPALPAGSKLHTVFNLGNVNPRVDFSNATATVLKWDSEQVDGNWVLTIDLKTLPYSFATECWPWSDPWSDPDTQESGDYCTNPRHRVDYESYAQVAIWANTQEPSHPENSPQSGVWVSNNATGGESPSLDATTLTMTMNYAGPPTKIDGSPNYISAQAFFPDSTLSGLYGVDPASISSMSSFTVTRTDGSSTSSVTATLTRVTGNTPGLLVNIPNIVTYVTVAPGIRSVADQNNMAKTTPKIKIKIRNFKPAKPGVSTITSKRVNGKFALITVNASNFATGIQTKCTKGSKSKVSNDYMPAYAIASIKLTKGTWNCKVRSVRSASGKKLYSSWSKTAKIKIK